MLNELKSLFTTKVFLLGLLIRLLVMPFTGHWDIRGINFAVHNLPFKGITNVYEVAANGPVEYFVNVNFGRDYFIYPPLNYWTLGTVQWLLKPLYGSGFVTWLEGYGNDLLAVVSHPQVWRYLFLMKIPYLIFDIAMVILLMKFFTKQSDRQRVQKYWWLNPIVIFLPYVWGQFDIIPAFFMTWGIYLGVRSKPYHAALLFGVAASYKNYPLMLLPLLAVVLGNNLKSMLKLFFTGLAPFILTTLPYWGHEFFQKTVLFSWQSQKMLDFLWPISSSEGVYPFVIGYGLLLLWTLYHHSHQPKVLMAPLVTILMWYYATTNFHQQWFMWVLPMLTLYAVRDRRLYLISLWVIGLFFLRLFEIQANVTNELFIWLAPAFDDLPKSRYLLSLAYDIHKLRNIVDSFYVATALFVSWYVQKREAINS